MDDSAKLTIAYTSQFERYWATIFVRPVLIWKVPGNHTTKVHRQPVVDIPSDIVISTGGNDMERDAEIAMVMLENWGETSTPPEKWEKWAWAVTDYCPDHLERELGYGEFVTVLDFSTRALAEAPDGWENVHQYGAGEKSCPWCGDGTGEEERRSECTLCQGNGTLYWGDECQVVVFKKLEEEESEEDSDDEDEDEDADDHNFGNAAW